MCIVLFSLCFTKLYVMATKIRIFNTVCSQGAADNRNKSRDSVVIDVMFLWRIVALQELLFCNGTLYKKAYQSSYTQPLTLSIKHTWQAVFSLKLCTKRHIRLAVQSLKLGNKWGEWLASRLGRFIDGEIVCGTHWTGCWVLARAGLGAVEGIK